MKATLTLPRLVVIERALRHRMKADPPIKAEDRKHYEKALQWAQEQRAKRAQEQRAKTKQPSAAGR